MRTSIRAMARLAPALLFLCGPTTAASTEGDGAAPRVPRPEVKRSTKHDLSPPLALMKSPPPRPGKPRERINRLPDVLARFREPALVDDPLQARQAMPQAPMPAPLLTFEGTSDDDNAAVVGFRVIPPDTNGDVGPNHYVQWNNLILAVYNKANGQIAPGFPKAGNTLFVGFGGPCEETNDGDPIALYDQFADRWVLSQPAFGTGTQCVAVSQTSDPTGSYYRYAFDVSPYLNDYPKLGIWPDGYYLSFNEFKLDGGWRFTQVKVGAFERTKMLKGESAQMVVFGVNAPAGIGCQGEGECYFSLQPSHVEGRTPPPAGSPNYFVMPFDDEAWSTQPATDEDGYRLWRLSVDWLSASDSTLTGPVGIPTAEFSVFSCPWGQCIPTKDYGQLDALSFWTMYRLVYRRSADHESLLVTHTVAVDSFTRAAVRFAEIRDPSGTPTVYQAGTHAPPDGEHRWMPSAAMDKDGNIAIGYSVASINTYPSIRYAGRLATDPLGTLPQTETEMHAGTGTQYYFSRWGDYAAMSIDEADDCTFWFTTEYYRRTGLFDFNTRIGAFKFPSCTPEPMGNLAGTVTSTSGNPIPGATVQASAFSTTADAAGVYRLRLSPGTYDVTASHSGHSSAAASGVVVGADQTTTQDFSLAPLPTVVVDGFVTDGLAAGWPLYAKIEVQPRGRVTKLTLFTDPHTGQYSVNLLADTTYDFTVTPQVPGYVGAARVVRTGSANQRESFALEVDLVSCSAPGYSLWLHPILQESFEAGIPATWTVTDEGSGCSDIATPRWTTTGGTPDRRNWTGGSGAFAIADSDSCHPLPLGMDTSLVTPSLDLSSLRPGDSLQVSFNLHYWDACQAASGEAVALDVWNGAAWIRAFDFCGTHRPGPRVERFGTAAANGVTAARVRWRYRAGWDWYWEIDNVQLSLGHCAFTGGGVIYGSVYDANTGLALNGATVTLEGGQTATTVATPEDPNFDDGFYMIAAPPAPRTLTVSKPRYGAVHRVVAPGPGGNRREDVHLPAGRLLPSPGQLRQRLPIGSHAVQVLTLANAGGNPATFKLLEIDAPAAPSPRASVLRNAGEWVSEFDTGLENAWGVGYNLAANDLWVSGRRAAGEPWYAHRFLPDGSATGDVIDGASGDMTYNSRTGMLWSDWGSCLKELDPVAKRATGNEICPAWGFTWVVAVAYDPVRNTYYVGTYDDGYSGSIIEVAPGGTIVRRASDLPAISGLAFNPTTGHLFAQMVSDAHVWVLDVRKDFTTVGTIRLLDRDGQPASGYATDLELDCQGNLWWVDYWTKKVIVNRSGEPSGVCIAETPWLTETPKVGNLLAGESVHVAVRFEAAGMSPGCREAQVIALNDTPYGDLAVPVGLTVEFADMPAGSFADPFIHAIAGAGVTYGCGGGNFCPGNPMTRRTAAVWLLRAKFGADYIPPLAVGIFADVPPASFAAEYIEDLYNKGITMGCSAAPLLYCPDQVVSRAQVAVLLLRTLLGAGYTPPACTGIFGDVACSHPFAPWMEDLYRRGITSGCSANPPMFCPNALTTRAQMAVLVSRAFAIPPCRQ